MTTPQQALEIIKADAEKVGVKAVQEALSTLTAHYNNSLEIRSKSVSLVYLEMTFMHLSTVVNALKNVSTNKIILMTTFAEKTLKSYSDQLKTVETVLIQKGVDTIKLLESLEQSDFNKAMRGIMKVPKKKD